MSNFQRGFSLVEAIIVIIISGIMIAAVALFLRWPFQSYLDAARHEQISDTVDTALRRIGRDLHIALPNSIRVTQGATTCMEMLPTIAGGRYRTNLTSLGGGTYLDFTNGSSSFDMFGKFSALPGQSPALVPPFNLMVVYNLGPTSPGADAYSQNNTAAIKTFVYPDPNPGAPAQETLITLPAVTLFPLASPSKRFQVIGPAASAALSYVCMGVGIDGSGNGTGTLTRVAGYGMTPVQACPPPAGGTTTLLANNLSLCSIQYRPAGGTDTTAREGLVSMQFAIEQANDAVNIYNEVHVNNAP